MKNLVMVGLVMGLGVGAGYAQSVAPPAGQKVVLTAEGRGVQIYKCDKVGEATKWVFVAPEAKLFVQDDEVGTHGAGPVWAYMGGTVHGKVLVTQMSPDAGSVAWLLLKATGYSGNGPMTTVTYIRRSDTKGGSASEDGCDADHLGTMSRVPYSATYTFYSAVK